MVLKLCFQNLLQSFTSNDEVILAYWKELEKAYQNRNRAYHNLTHLENMFLVLEQSQIIPVHKEALEWAIFYHDIVYKATKKNNERKSAELCEIRMKELNVASEIRTLCFDMILATQKHQKSANESINLMLDLDMSILGQPWEVYQKYMAGVRKEYAIYPDLVYRPGRKKVLESFLQQPIFHTSYFREKYEEKAMENIKREIAFLNNGK